MVQSCTISGEPVTSSVYTSFSCVLMEPGSASSAAMLAEEGDYDIEEVNGDTADLGEIASQYLGLEINPYPTSPDAMLTLPQSAVPFASLGAADFEGGEDGKNCMNS